jgi:hypothetical protein
MAKPKTSPSGPARGGVPTSERTVVTFRFPSDLDEWLRAEAKRRNWSLNELMVTLAQDVFTWYAQPRWVVEALEADRGALDLDRREYVTWLLMKRYEEVREKGPAFDKQSIQAGVKSGKP